MAVEKGELSAAVVQVGMNIVLLGDRGESTFIERSAIGCAVLGQEVIIIRREQLSGETPLFEIVEASSSLSGLPGAVEGRKQQAGQYCDDRNDHEELDQCEAAPGQPAPSRREN